MYQTKAKGKNGFTFFTPDLNERALERLEMEGLLRRALDQGELRLHYQPQFQLDGTLCGCEALVRWEHPRLGMIAPGRFIPLAEETGLILPIGKWVLKEACRCMAGWIQRGYQGLTIAVNVSSMQFEQDDFVLQVEEALAAENLSPHQLELELTESLVMENPRENARRLEALRALGVRIAVDDFGTGYSSLSYLQRLPLDTLKIDQSFVRDIYPDAGTLTSSAPIVETIIGLARSLHLSLMAEGVETEAQREFLRSLQCDGMQGYLLGRPMDAVAFGVLLASLSE
jgi:EAL domain-containing protein (putative c-di-GMP-specific phosphodiesterase class I)